MPRRLRIGRMCVRTVAASLLVSTGVFGEWTAGVAHAVTPPPPPADFSRVASGAYLDYGPAGVERMEKLSRWLGGADLRVGHTYLPGDRWSNIEGGPGFLDGWARWRHGADDRMFVLNVPMLERNESRVPDRRVRRMLRTGAAGWYDHHFSRLAARLVGLGLHDTVIVLGWEMNGTTYTHRCGPDPAAWKAYWRRIVTAMRSVPGQSFRFDFAPNRGTDAIAWPLCYPGDDVVDVVGMDSYDQAPGKTFAEQAAAPYGLRHQVEFAAAHGKPISYPEWGLFRNGDNPDYMRGMLEWIARHKPLYQTITDYCPHGVWQCGDNPKSSRVYRSMLFARPVGVPEPSASSTPPVPPVPQTPTVPALPAAPAASPAQPTAPAPSFPSAAPTPGAPASTAAPTTAPSAVPSAVSASASAPSSVPLPSSSASASASSSSSSSSAPTPSAAPAVVTAPAPVEEAEPAPEPTPAPALPAPALDPAPVSVPVTTPAPEPTPTPAQTAAPAPAPPPATRRETVPRPAPPFGPVPLLNAREWCVPADLGGRLARWISGRAFCVTVPWPATWPFGPAAD